MKYYLEKKNIIAHLSGKNTNDSYRKLKLHPLKRTAHVLTQEIRFIYFKFKLPISDRETRKRPLFLSPKSGTASYHVAAKVPHMELICIYIHIYTYTVCFEMLPLPATVANKKFRLGSPTKNTKRLLAKLVASNWIIISKVKVVYNKHIFELCI